MATISKQQLKEEIDHLDNQYLELVYKILRQLGFFYSLRAW